jgi:hypothetical protein
MHDIKLFFSIKIISQFRGAKKILEGKLTKALSKNTIFLKSREDNYFPDPTWIYL